MVCFLDRGSRSLASSQENVFSEIKVEPSDQHSAEYFKTQFTYTHTHTHTHIHRNTHIYTETHTFVRAGHVFLGRHAVYVIYPV